MEPDSQEFIYQVEEPEDSDSNNKIASDNIVKSSTSIPFEVTPMIPAYTDFYLEANTLIPLEVTPVITDLTDVSPKDKTPNLPEVTSIITKYVVFSEDLPDKLPLTCDIQYAI